MISNNNNNKRCKVDNENGKHKKKMHWSCGLMESIKNPNLIIIENENLVVIEDKFPKAKVHYLILPQENINSISEINETHIRLLEEFVKTYEDLKTKHTGLELTAGFHAVPSMQGLHLHVISTDFISPCLKSKKHWNSFNTNFFLSISGVILQLKENGCTTLLPREQYTNLLSTPLQCNQCNYKPKNMPMLKAHLLSHNLNSTS